MNHLLESKIICSCGCANWNASSCFVKQIFHNEVRKYLWYQGLSYKWGLEYDVDLREQYFLRYIQLDILKTDNEWGGKDKPSRKKLLILYTYSHAYKSSKERVKSSDRLLIQGYCYRIKCTIHICFVFLHHHLSYGGNLFPDLTCPSTYVIRDQHKIRLQCNNNKNNSNDNRLFFFLNIKSYFVCNILSLYW